MFFWKRKSEVVNPVPVPEVLPQLPQNRKYRTNFYTLKGSKHRESPRCKNLRKGEIGEYKIEVGLGQLPRCYKLSSNLLFKTEQGFEHIDHLVISPYGLFIIEVNNLSGIILGEETDLNWHQAITWRVKTFPNPLFKNQNSIEVLSKWVNLDEKLPIYSFVTFSRRSDLKVISGSVFYDTDILTVIRKRTQQEVLSEAEVLAVYNKIGKANILDPNIRNKYSARLRKERLLQRPQYGDIRCRICQKAVSQRSARYCITHPDKFAWQIYCAKHQKELTRLPRVDQRNR
ncbi:nuclease-related domain-containing protein [Desulfitobacterium sp.]|uniref:nuclease-related domain-containing protein n=1 Tax=Desulfitobacterium sp. TaxID=49981 RepID=UPI002D0AA39C|nr:nuclease-related domain-containing protein [Desulfitobacterium sp.]HVJ48727.1 nuclease-related domain-containing protein [Desulfitobacterium sp.]